MVGYSGRQRRVFIWVFVFFISMMVWSQESQPDESKKLRTELLAAFESGGKERVVNFVKDRPYDIDNKFIVEFAKAGVKERKEDWLEISLILVEEKKDEKTKADVWYQMGEYFRLISNNKEALRHFEKAIEIYSGLNDINGQGNAYQSKGLVYLFIGDFANANKMYEKALPFLEKSKDILGQGYVYMGKGIIWFYTGHKEKAFEMYDKALICFEEVKSSSGQGNIYRLKGEAYFIIRKNSSALDMLNKALYFYEEVKDFIGEGNVYKKMGDIHFNSGDNTKALEMYDKALVLFEKMAEPLGQGNVYLSKGDIYYRIGKNSDSVEMYDKALYFYKKADDPFGQGNVYYLKGGMCIKTGNISDAFLMFRKALIFFERAGDPLGQGNIYASKGDIYVNIGDHTNALGMYDKAFKFYEKAEDPMGKGWVYFRKGDIYLYLGKHFNALEMYDKSLSIYEKADQPIDQANVYRSKGDVYLYSGEYNRAIEMYNEAMVLFEKGNHVLGQGHVYRSKGNLYLKKGEYSKALEMYDKSLFLYKRIENIESVAYSLLGKARALVKLKNNRDAFEFYEDSISKLEKIRRQTAFSHMKRTFTEKVHDLYRETTVFMLENNFHEKGFKYAELMKARSFLDQLAEGLVTLDKGISSKLKEKRDNLLSKLSFLSKEIDIASNKRDDKKLTELKEQHRKVEGDLGKLLIKIRLENPRYASVRYPEPVSLQELQKNVLKNGELLLRYFISPDKLYVFLISKEEFTVVPLEIKENNINVIIKNYLDSVETENVTEIKNYARRLYRRVFKPLEAFVKERNNIIIVPDGNLAKIPFESLVIDTDEAGKPVYLVKKYRTKYVQSATVLAILRKHYRKEGTTSHFVGFGDPVYDYENFKKVKSEKGQKGSPVVKENNEDNAIRKLKGRRYEKEGGLWTRLEGSGKEVKTIAGFFKKHAQKTVVHEREKATEEKAKAAEMKTFDYIHFSCHGVLGDGFQGLVLTQLPKSLSSEDGYFTLDEVMNCDYHAKLVVLSACQTGKGKMERGEGVTGLTRAIMYAGTPAVVASLWKVSEIGTKELMIKFYRYMIEEKLSKEEALRRAKLDLMKSKEYSSPFYWSAFVMYGE